jgi:uncharacterized protein (DUF58 family)
LCAFFAFVTRELDFYRIFYMSGFILILCFVWARFSITGIRLERSSRITRQHAGTLFEELYEIQNLSKMPKLWVEILDQSILSSEKNRSHVITLLNEKSTRRYQVRYLLRKRGEFQLGPTHIISGDPFGLFERRMVINSQKSVLVLPCELSAHEIGFPKGVLSGGKARKATATEITPYVSSIRDYASGDSFNRIDWKSSARRNKLMAKEFDQDPQSNVWVFLDGDISECLKINENPNLPKAVNKIKQETEATLFEDSFEYAVSYTLSICKRLLRYGNTIGLVCNETPINILPPEKGERQLNKFLEMLTFAKCNGNMGIAGIVLSQSKAFSKGNTVVLITASVKPELVVLGENLERRGISSEFILISREDFGGTGTNLFHQRMINAGINAMVIKH